jgi:hypothetical protein
MRTRSLWFSVLAAAALTHAARAEDEDDVDVADARSDAGGAPETAEQERLDALIQQLSPECRAEVQGSYADGSQVSDSCRAEIQSVLQQPGKTDDGTPKADPRPAILAFVTLLCAGLVGFWVYANNNLVSKDSGAKKKLSAAKLLKQKMKEQRERQGMIE